MQKTHNKWKEVGTSSFLIKKQKHRETHLSKILCPESKTFASISFNWQLFEHNFGVMSCAESYSNTVEKVTPSNLLGEKKTIFMDLRALHESRNASVRGSLEVLDPELPAQLTIGHYDEWLPPYVKPAPNYATNHGTNHEKVMIQI